MVGLACADLVAGLPISVSGITFLYLFYSQVMDSENGWTTFRPYVPLTWGFLRVNFRAPFLLSSATMEEDSLKRITGD